MIAKNPGFAAAAVLVLALGIGPNSAIFSMVSAVLMRPLPVREPDRVVSVWESNASLGLPQIPASEANYLDWKRQSDAFERTGTAFALPEYGVNVLTGTVPERVQAMKASAGFFDVIGISPRLGRGFLEEEDVPGGPPVVLVSQPYWQRNLHADPGVVGRTIKVDGLPRTVVGVLPASAQIFGKVDIVLPVGMDPHSAERNNRAWGVFARLKPGVTIQQAQAQMSAIAQRLAVQYPSSNQGWGVNVVPLRQLLGGMLAAPLMILLGAVGVLLLLACANVANLLLAKATGRQREIAIRTALGAGRWQIARQFLMESVVLALAGGALGLVLAHLCVNLLPGFVPHILSLMQQMSIDGRVLMFTFVLSMLTGLVFGALPALKMTRANLGDTLKETGRAMVSAGVQRLRGGLVVAEVALALVLAVAAGLLAHSFSRLMAVNPGLRTENVLSMQLTLPGASYPEGPQRARFFKEIVSRIETLPGVRSAAAVSYLPFRSNFLNSRISVWDYRVEGEPAARPGQLPLADYRVVTPGFFDTLGIPLRQGRCFNDQDTPGRPEVVVINEAMARKHFAGRNPIGQRLHLPSGETRTRQVVGVVADAKLYALDWAAEPAVFVPHAQQPSPVMSLVVQGTGDPRGLTAAIRRELASLDREQPLADVRMMQEVMADSTALRRLSMGLIGAFALLAVVISSVGIYGLTAFWVSQRTHEIGLRMALGASSYVILRQVVGRGALLALGGVALGSLGALGVARALKGFLFGIPGMDPVVLLGMPGLLMAVAITACWFPARRAARVDAMTALRHD